MSLAVVRDVTVEPTRRHVDIRETVEELRRLNPRSGQERLAELLANRIEEDRHLLLDAARSLVRLFSAGTEGRERQRHAASAPVRARREEVTRHEVKRIVAKARQAILLDMLMTLPNGEQKPLRFCYGGEIEALGTAYQRIAEKVGKNAMVGEIMCESEVRALLSPEIK